MNSFMRASSSAEIQRWLKSEYGERCEHVERDVAAAFAVRGETDSFGPVSRRVVCEACDNAAQVEEEDEVVQCNDCKARHPRRETRTWKAYDFYAPQGDVALVLCHACWAAPKHVARMARDAAEEEAEFGPRKPPVPVLADDRYDVVYPDEDY